MGPSARITNTIINIFMHNTELIFILASYNFYFQFERNLLYKTGWLKIEFQMYLVMYEVLTTGTVDVGY
jgi:hypothetical protein